MNCAHALRFLVDSGDLPNEVREHLEECGACRACREESRRVADLMTDLPFTPAGDVASKVMARIGYGNGRPTRDKINEQLGHVRAELDEALSDLDEDVASWRPSATEPPVGELLWHLACAERERALEAGQGRVHPRNPRASASVGGTTTASESGEAAVHKAFATADTTPHDELRRVRSRTLRLLSEAPDTQLGHQAAELLRSIYRHEAEHVARIRDAQWRFRRQSELRHDP